MAMRTASPWWLSLAFLVGLLAVFISERLLGHTSGLRVAITGLGVVVMVAVAVARGWMAWSVRGAGRRIEATLLACHAGALVALGLYALTTQWGLGVVGVGEASADRFTGALTVVWVIAMMTSLIPMVMIELSLGVSLRTGFEVMLTSAAFGAAAGALVHKLKQQTADPEAEGIEQVDAGVEYHRVRQLGWSGLTVAFALALLMVTCGVARDRNVRRDVSYFKTSSPGESTINILKVASEGIKVHLFYPSVNEVQDQLVGYFEALGAETGKVQIERHDRELEAELAGKYKVQKDGYVVLARGTGEDEKHFSLEVDPDLEKARKATGKLRNLDREVNKMLMQLVRDKRKAYLLTGHGEITHPDSIPPELKGSKPTKPTTLFKKRLTDLHYEVKELAPLELVRDVPEDATVVILLAPMLPLERVEWDALDRYLQRGGRLMIALDPQAWPDLGPLEARLGVKLAKGSITDDVAFAPQRGSLADRRVALTTQFSSHATTTAVSRSGAPLYLIDAGALEDVPFEGGGEAPKKTITIRSMESSWLDTNPNFTFDADVEKKQKWNVAAAIEGPKVGDKDGFRALVFADVDLFVDNVGYSMQGRPALVMVGQSVFYDSIRWLGGEEVFAGEIVSEEDKPISHTKNQDAVWFTMTIIGIPVIVLSLGLLGTWARRRRAAKKTEVTP